MLRMRDISNFEKRSLFKNMVFPFQMDLITLAPITSVFINAIHKNNADLRPAFSRADEVYRVVDKLTTLKIRDTWSKDKSAENLACCRIILSEFCPMLWLLKSFSVVQLAGMSCFRREIFFVMVLKRFKRFKRKLIPITKFDQHSVTENWKLTTVKVSFLFVHFQEKSKMSLFEYISFPESHFHVFTGFLAWFRAGR